MIQVCIGNNISRKSIVVDENMTLRAAFEQEGIDYATGMASLDGVTLAAGGLDKTFADYGITTKCYLLTVVKADNAAKVKIAGSVAMVESEFTPEQITEVSKHRPNALCLYDGEGKDKEVVFCVGVTNKGTGSITPYGVSFAPVPSAAGKAIVTMQLDEGVTGADKVKAAVAEKIGTAILKLNKVEAGLKEQLDAVKAEKESILEQINVL